MTVNVTKHFCVECGDELPKVKAIHKPWLCSQCYAEQA